MTTFLLCHGGWAGGWQWREVAAMLRSAGHIVFTPTFTGLGERVHLAHPDIDMNTYIQDILMVKKLLKTMGPLKVDSETKDALARYLELDSNGNPTGYSRDDSTIDKKVRGLVHLIMCLAEFQLN